MLFAALSPSSASLRGALLALLTMLLSIAPRVSHAADVSCANPQASARSLVDNLALGLPVASSTLIVPMASSALGLPVASSTLVVPVASSTLVVPTMRLRSSLHWMNKSRRSISTSRKWTCRNTSGLRGHRMV